MNYQTLKQHCTDFARNTRQDYWPRLVHWLETHSPRSLFLRALLIGLLISVPWQCSRLVYHAYFSNDDSATAENSAPLSAPGGLSGSITDMPNPRARRAVASPAVSPEPAGEPGQDKTADASETAPQSVAGNHEAGVLERVAPKYPPAALRNNDSGTVMLGVLVDAAGRPDRIRIEKSSGSRELDRAAREAVMQWKFSARVVNGVPTDSELLIPVEFKLGE
ncbi:energy transducer TonB [Arenimonas sp. GDDSR-1]|uniref:energy transducer TonB n=1 Tax=Arenimonas sp. GDDSR-1 TaxID=2950125 RepID=UPI00260AE259|nr:energy transducer TonB [Arenimonas sp. GDDSR-1]